MLKIAEDYCHDCRNIWEIIFCERFRQTEVRTPTAADFTYERLEVT